jgi:hypothetical protein
VRTSPCGYGRRREKDRDGDTISKISCDGARDRFAALQQQTFAKRQPE